jgi:hypothetical protein
MFAYASSGCGESAGLKGFPPPPNPRPPGVGGSGLVTVERRFFVLLRMTSIRLRSGWRQPLLAVL